MSKTIPVAGCDSPDPKLLTVEQVHEQLENLSLPVTGTERVAIRSALGRVLDEDIISPIDVPPYANSAMDGYALSASELPDSGEQTLKVIGTSFAGDPFQGTVGKGECIRIMTGAKIANATDTVIMQEQVTINGDTIVIGEGHCAGQNVRHPGEDMAKGSVVIKAGKQIGAAEIGLLASLGYPEVNVKRKVRVAFFSTGDELRSVGEQLEEGQIYDSNRYTLYGMLDQLGVELIDMGVIRDDQQAIEDAFNHAADIADAIITSGGVSVGEADFVKLTLDKIGKVDFWRIAMKPGKPLALGKIKNAMLFGLPGNPVSVMATFYLFAQPALKRMMGMQYQQPIMVRAVSRSFIKKQPGRTDYQRGIARNQDGKLVVDGAGMQASHILSGMSQANCFVVIPQMSGSIEAGEEVDVILFNGLT
jgi:molybdopterin molybdotransferase